MNEKTQGYTFLCTNSTEDECLHRMLFGGTIAYKNKTAQIKPGDKIFLYNFQAGRLHGLFIAKSSPGLNIVPEAWGGKYPWQVLVDRVEEYTPLSTNDFTDIMPLQRGFTPAIINPQTLEIVIERFEQEERLPPEEHLFRKEFPAKYRTSDGHMVRSQAEITIDDWLFHKDIAHGYERKLPTEELGYCDFFIPHSKTGQTVYIEYWGMEDNKYLVRKKDKLEIYNKNNLVLIELFPSDLESLDDSLVSKLRKHFPNKEF